MSDIIKQLRDIRRDRELSQGDVSEMSGICSGQYIARMELGQSAPAWSTLTKWADALGYQVVLRAKG